MIVVDFTVVEIELAEILVYLALLIVANSVYKSWLILLFIPIHFKVTMQFKTPSVEFVLGIFMP